MNETIDDYLARLNLEEGRGVWLGNRPKIKYVFNKSKRYLKSGMSACEIGVGDGYLLRLLDDFALTCTGIDISNYLVKELRLIFENEERKINLLQCDISDSIDEEKVFDVVFCLDLLEHIEGEGLKRAINNVKKLLKERGLLIATLPWKETLAKRMVMCPFCRRTFHRIGHFHSFHSYDDIFHIIGEDFRILSFEFVPGEGLHNKIQDFLKKTVLRARCYKNGLPNFPAVCMFIAQLNPHGQSSTGYLKFN